MKNPFLSIITPAYNRAHTLGELKKSIAGQTFRDFEWIVIDDGSTDDTSHLLHEWENDPDLNLVHTRQENGGKHRALNAALKCARGELIFIVDSDDRLPPNALETIHSVWAKIPPEEKAGQIAGIIGLKADVEGNIIGETLPHHVHTADALTLTYRYGIRGDKAEVFRADVLKRFPFPEFEGEKFLTEAIVWYRIARAGYALYLVNAILYETSYHADGLSARSLQLRIANIQGTLLFYREEIEKGGLPLRGMLRESTNYLRFVLHARAQGRRVAVFSGLSPYALSCMCCAAVPALIVWAFDRIRLKRLAEKHSQRTQKQTQAEPVKVLHVINSLAQGGAERLLSELLPQLQHLGVHNTVLALDGRNAVFADPLIAAGIPVIFARQRSGHDNAASPFNPLHVVSVVRTIRQIQPAFVHAHLAPSFHWCAVASLFAHKPVYITTEHASQNKRMHMPLLKGFEAWCYSRYRTVICVSTGVNDALRDWLHLPPSKLIVIPNGIDPGKFGPDGEPAADVRERLQGRKGIAMTARLVPVKDHETALRTLALLSQQYALVLIGDGPERKAIEERARALGIVDRCLLLGARNDVPQILRACHLYLQTSIKEGFGIAVLEAMASRLPVVASNVSGLAELVKDAGLFFPQGDARAAAAALLRLEEPEERRKAIQRGLERAQQYSLQHSAEKYAQWYHSQLQE